MTTNLEITALNVLITNFCSSNVASEHEPPASEANQPADSTPFSDESLLRKRSASDMSLSSHTDSTTPFETPTATPTVSRSATPRMFPTRFAVTPTEYPTESEATLLCDLIPFHMREAAIERAQEIMMLTRLLSPKTSDPLGFRFHVDASTRVYGTANRDPLGFHVHAEANEVGGERRFVRDCLSDLARLHPTSPCTSRKEQILRLVDTLARDKKAAMDVLGLRVALPPTTMPVGANTPSRHGSSEPARLRQRLA